jgi:hypothetical protein
MVRIFKGKPGESTIQAYRIVRARAEFHEDAGIGYRLYDGNGFCLSRVTAVGTSSRL